MLLPIQDKIISPPLAEFIHRELEQAGEYDGVVFLIDTPGGFLPPTERIVKDILALDVPTVAFIYPKGARAGSAGVFISFACDMVVMAPNTRIGAAHPVMFGHKGRGERDNSFAYAETINDVAANDVVSEEEGGWDDKEVMKEKVLNDVLAMFRSYVKDKHPQVDLALCEDLVKKSRSLTAEEALEANLIDGMCEDLDEVIELAVDRGLFPKADKTRFVEAEMRGVDLVMYYLTNPYLLYILSSISVLLLIFELTHLGFGLPGIVGLVGLGLVMYGYGFLPVNYLGILLTVLGVVFCIAEVFVPGFGLLAGSGVLLMLWGAVLTWRSPGSLFRFNLTYLLPVILLSAGAVIGIVALALKIRRKRSITGPSGMVGKICEVVEEVGPKKGKVFCMGEYWNARTEGETIEKGKEVEVLRVDGLVLVVRERRG